MNAPQNFSLKKALAWAVYDFANTIYSAIVVTVYLPLYVTQLLGKNTPLGVTATVSMILAGCLVPFLGILSDRTGKTKTYLYISTLLCVLSTCFLSLPGNGYILLALFLAANVFYHSSLTFYNSLLPVVAPPEKQGWVSGLGTGLGYLGVLFALPIAHVLDTTVGRRWVFLLAGILFFLFSLPLFLQVPERKERSREKTVDLRKILADVKGNRPMLYLLLGNFFLVDALNTVILWLSVFLSKIFGLPQGKLIQTMMILNFSAFLFGLLMGKLTDKIGFKKILLSSAASLACVLLAVALIPSFKIVSVFIFVFGGAAAAGVWTAGRKGVLSLCPEEEVGGYFGLYGLTTKVSAIGSTTLSLLADVFGFRTALLSQLVSLALAFILISRVKRSQ